MGILLSDNFARTAGTLGPNWSQLINGFSANNGAIGTSNGTFNLDGYISQFALNQQVSCTIGTFGADLPGVAFRITPAGGGTYNYYLIGIATTGVTVYKIIGGSTGSDGAVTMLQTFVTTVNPGDTVTACNFGPNIVIFINSLGNPAVINFTDSTLTSGVTTSGLFETSNLSVIGSWNAYNFIAPAGTKLNVICDGDSKTWGQILTTPWPNLLTLPVSPNNVNNFGVDGQKLSDMVTYAPTYIDPLIAPGAQNVCIVGAGTNDLGNGASVQQLFASLQSYCAARKAAGWKVVTWPLLSCNGIDTLVQQFNAMLSEDSPADATAVFPDVLVAPGAYLNSQYFGAGSHPNQTAAGIMATDISAALNQVVQGQHSISGNSNTVSERIYITSVPRIGNPNYPIPDSTVTDSNGNYVFNGLNNGTYLLCRSSSRNQLLVTINGSNAEDVNFLS